MIKNGKCEDLNNELVIPLNCLSKGDVNIAGGKAANLGELVRAGFPVPQGFAITTKAYDIFVAQNRLQEIIAGVSSTQPEGGVAIRAAFEAAPIPKEIETKIISAYNQLGAGAVAVRSSATAEDLPQAAFAGQQDTFLNVIGEEALLDAVRRCWASLWTNRAITYRDRQGVEQTSIRLAVVIQNMVPAEIAGVMFTANPVTGTRNEIHIDANPGLGEAVVSGLVTPDHYVLRQHLLKWHIVERKIGKHEVFIQGVAGGGTESVSNSIPDNEAILPDRELRRLAGLGSAIQRHFGNPQDIEWAWAAGKLFILQARPITALPVPPPKANIAHRLLANNFIEMLPVRPYPLDLDTWMSALGSAVEPLFSLLGLDWSLLRLFEVKDGLVIHYNVEFPRPTWKVLLAPFRLLSRAARYNPLEWKSDPLLAEMIARARAMEAQDLSALSWGDLLNMVDAAKDISYLAAGEIRSRYFPRAVFAAVRLRLFLMILGQADKFSTLISGAENKTREMNQALENLARNVRTNANLYSIFSTYQPEDLLEELAKQPEGRQFLDQFHAFMDQYGHRETIVSTSLIPTWKDSPELALGIIKSFAIQPPPLSAATPAWQTARDQILQLPRLQSGALRTAFLKTLELARSVIQIREDTHFYATLSMPIFRRVLFEFGRRLVIAGALDIAEDVYFLRLAELKKFKEGLTPDILSELRSSVQRRKQARLSLDDTPLVDTRIFPSPSSDDNAILGGMPGSPGVVEGPACIVRDSSEFDKLSTGDVLIAPYTNPSWTPLFLRAAAIVVDTGSLASHAAIVAREYGIPAVMGTINGTQTIQDREQLRVDGNQGKVYRITRASQPGKRVD